ncbi:hypothetical protein LTS08_005312 [Lithohypha guttulata]|nr:hypothetical protein LTS08_005312 [Lithohypha guttulata]
MDKARLRKTFKYPSEDEHSTNSRDELDEEEQENVISSLQSQSQTSNATYTMIFTLLPLAIAPLFVYYLIFSSTVPARLRLLCLLALTSLLASSFTMFFLSNADGIDARARLDRRQREVTRSTFANAENTSGSFTVRVKKIFEDVLDKLDDARLDLDVEGPLLQVLPILNGVMCMLLAVAAWALRGRDLKGVPEYMWLYLLMPGVMATMTTVARRSIMDEQKEIQELRGMKYGYKGA